MTDLLSFNVETMQPIGRLTPQGVDAQTTPRKAVGGPGREEQPADIKKACSEFESLFLNYMLKEMRETIPKDGLLSGGKGESIYTSMMDTYLSREIASKRSIGLVAFFERHLEAVINPETKTIGQNGEAIPPDGNTGKPKRGLK